MKVQRHDAIKRSGGRNMKKAASILCMMMISVGMMCTRSNEEFGGLGIEVPSGNGIVTAEKPYTIVGVYEGGAGHAAGLMPGDVIEAIDGKALLNMKHDDVVNTLLRGKVDSEVVLTVRREGKQLTLRAVRKKIIVERE